MTSHSVLAAHGTLASQPVGALAVGAAKEDAGRLQSHFAQHDDKRMDSANQPQAQKPGNPKWAHDPPPASRQRRTAAPPQILK
jgi:hypothetical protein